MTLTDPGATGPHGLDEGVALALKAQDGGPAVPLLDWLGRNPGHAAALAAFLAKERGIRNDIAPPHPGPSGTVGGYQILGELGRGGMGVVYRALDVKLKREVALKLMPGEDDGRFRFEAEAAARLSHDNVVPVYGVGEEAGMSFLVMKVMEGGSLAARLKALGPDRRRPPREAAQLVRDVALGVHHAHQCMLLHRDLKPGNVLLDAAGRPHVADFGLAKPLDESASTAAGTVAYMAPEQARGERALTVAVDVHALGAILFELLTGGPPFGLDDLMAVASRVRDEPAPPVRAARPDCPPDLAAVCARCLEKQPDDRYPSAAALAADLDRVLDGEPIGGHRRPGTTTAVIRAFQWRRPTDAMGTWPAAFVGAASTLLALVVVQAAVLLDAPPWVSWAGLGYYVAAWLMLLWWFLVNRRDTLNPVERMSTSYQFGMAFTAIAIVPAQLWLHDGSAPPVFQPLLAAVGLGIFAHGLYWGRMYVAGLVILAASVALLLVPMRYWPGVYGLCLTVFQAWAGVHLRRFHRAARPPT